MIIKYPTGYYSRAQLADNITYTISSSQPFSGLNSTIKIPEGIVLQNPRINQNGISADRSQYGQKILTVTNSSSAYTGVAVKQFTYGQAIESSASVSSLDAMVVKNGVEILHNQNVLDLTSLGLDPSVQSVIASAGLNAFEALRTKLNDAIKDRASAEVLIANYNNQLVECNKAISALQTIQSIQLTDFSEAISSLNAKILELNGLISHQSDIANNAANVADSIRDQMQRVAVVVK